MDAFGTVTRLSFDGAEATAEAVTGLAELLDEAAGRYGFVAGHLLRADEAELILVTVYSSEAAAESLSAELRPRMAETVGPLVRQPPDRSEGDVVHSASR